MSQIDCCQIPEEGATCASFRKQNEELFSLLIVVDEFGMAASRPKQTFHDPLIMSAIQKVPDILMMEDEAFSIWTPHQAFYIQSMLFNTTAAYQSCSIAEKIIRKM